MVALADVICNCGRVFTPKYKNQKACKPMHADYEWGIYLQKLAENSPFEIGCMYRMGERWFIGISESQLLTLTSTSQVQIIKPELRGKYSHLIGVSFEELCQKWKVSEPDLDRILNANIIYPGVVRMRELN